MKDILIGANYFAGWWEALPNKWGSWRDQFPDRIPLLGDFNSQETMDKEIVVAADHGVDFFAILWYFIDPTKKHEPHAELLNEGLKAFLASPNSHRMSFYIEYCNHPPFGITQDQDWFDCIRVWIDAMKHPSYLKIAGRPVFKIHGGRYFHQQNDNDPAKAKLRLDSLRKATQDANLGNPLIGCGVMCHEPISRDDPLAKLFDFTNTYMDVPPLPQRAQDYPFEELSRFTEQGRAMHAGDALPYIPHIAAGWNPRPWHDPRPSFAMPTKQQWISLLKQVRSDFNSTPNFGITLANGQRQRLFTIYAWNEFGEGGILAPTKSDGYMKLEALTEVFAAQQETRLRMR